MRETEGIGQGMRLHRLGYFTVCSGAVGMTKPIARRFSVIVIPVMPLCQSAGGPAHSRTLARKMSVPCCAGAFWTAQALLRFPSPGIKPIHAGIEISLLTNP